MGLFNTLHMNLQLLPVSEEERELLKKMEFQTKYLSHEYTDAFITDEGYFELDFRHYGEVERIRLYKITDLEFYPAGEVNGKSLRFHATFINGKLRGIKRVD